MMGVIILTTLAPYQWQGARNPDICSEAAYAIRDMLMEHVGTYKNAPHDP